VDFENWKKRSRERKEQACLRMAAWMSPGSFADITTLIGAVPRKNAGSSSVGGFSDEDFERQWHR
jgi:hypothetical protein